MSFLGALGSIGQIIGSVGSAIGGFMGMKSQENINQQNIDLMREQMAWQERLSNTAHQREVLDLKKAGLNPLLSAKHAGAGGGSSIGLPQLSNPVTKALEAISSAKMLSEIGLQNEMRKTEQTKQISNIAEANFTNSAKQLKDWEKHLFKDTYSVLALRNEFLRSKAGMRLYKLSEATGAIGNVLRGSAHVGAGAFVKK